jgi:ribosome-binding protein aMBF1 (putative translation factor)
MSKKTNYKSEIISSLLEERSNSDYNRIKNKMELAAKIKKGMNRMGLSNSDLALKLDKNNSVITKWVSGTNNFTIDTLTEIQDILNIKLIDSNDNSELVKTEYHLILSVGPGEKLRIDSPESSFEVLSQLNVNLGRC